MLSKVEIAIDFGGPEDQLYYSSAQQGRHIALFIGVVISVIMTQQCHATNPNLSRSHLGVI